MPSVFVSSNSNLLTQSVIAGTNREFALNVDEPVGLGGENRGPTPYDLLLAALGSCMSMTMILYAKRKNWNLENIEIQLSHDRVHARDCEECETKTGMIDQITVETKITGELEESQIERILAIGRRCPVHTTLVRQVSIVHNEQNQKDTVKQNA